MRASLVKFLWPFSAGKRSFKGLWTSSGWSRLFPGSIWYLLRERCSQLVVALYPNRRQKTNIYYAQHLLCPKSCVNLEQGGLSLILDYGCARTDVKCKSFIAGLHNHEHLSNSVGISVGYSFLPKIDNPDRRFSWAHCAWQWNYWVP